MELTKTNSDIAQYGEKYNFYYNTGNGTVVCTTTYKGHIVRGIAKCSPEDEFSIDVGKKLSYLRCRYKLAKKKAARARKAYKEAVIAKAAMDDKFGKTIDFVHDSDYQLLGAMVTLHDFECELNEENQ